MTLRRGLSVLTRPSAPAHTTCRIDLHADLAIIKIGAIVLSVCYFSLLENSSHLKLLFVRFEFCDVADSYAWRVSFFLMFFESLTDLTFYKPCQMGDNSLHIEPCRDRSANHIPGLKAETNRTLLRLAAFVAGAWWSGSCTCVAALCSLRITPKR